MVRAMRALALLFVGITLGISFSSIFCNGESAVCIKSESQALLNLKKDLKDPSNRLSSWTSEGDCCKWVGVVCDNSTGHVLELHLRNHAFDAKYEVLEKEQLGGAINPSLLNLKHLRYIDLSYNGFEGIQIPKFLGSLESLTHLNLSGAGFGGVVPHQLGNLSNLQYLNLGGINQYLYIDNLQWLSDLSLLQHLDLSSQKLSRASDWLQVANSLPSLLELHLRYCELPHISSLPHVNFTSLAILDLSGNPFNSLIPDWIFSLDGLVSLNLYSCDFYGPIHIGLPNMTALRELDLSSNNFNSTIPDWFYSLSRLEFLDLAFNNFNGTISSAIGNLTSAIDLNLAFNNLQGRLPKSMGKLCNLRIINLSGFKLEVSEVTELLSRCISDGLETLTLEGNQLSGQLADVIDRLGESKHLTSLSLTNNSFFGSIPESLGRLASLKQLQLGSNKFTGDLPVSLGKLMMLGELRLSDNELDGVVSEVHFENLTRLTIIDVPRNPMSFKFSSNWDPPFQLQTLLLQSCRLGPLFPTWIRSQKSLIYLDLSNSGIKDTISSWFWEISSHCLSLILSNNQIHGEISNIPFSQFPLNLDPNPNRLEDPLLAVSSKMSILDLSDNLISGSLSNFLCNKMGGPMNLVFLNIKGNLLSGEIPDCWMNYQRLRLIKLDNNNLTGNLPASLGSLSNLHSLHLRNNYLSGELPASLQNCIELIVVELGENELFGSIPNWIGERLLKLRILNLQSNRFSDHIPFSLCALAYLQILVLASNNLSGTIPKCFNNFSAMATDLSSLNDILNMKQSSYSYLTFPDDELLAMKGKLLEYSSNLGIVAFLDLSDNYFLGDIPLELTSLLGLQALNLSRNQLSGKIPEEIGNMVLLESIDFSINELSGEIPQTMSSLTFLSVLNLSHNNLSGRIPTGSQLQRFEGSSFVGNHLCGPPLNENCSTSDELPSVRNVAEDADGLGVDWFHVIIALGFVVGCCGICGLLLFNKACRFVYFDFLDRTGHKLWSC